MVVNDKLALCLDLIKNRGFYTSAHDLLNLLDVLGKRDEIRVLSSTLSLFHNKFNKFYTHA